MKNNCSVSFADSGRDGMVPFDISINYEIEFRNNAWRTQLWTVVFWGTLGAGANCCGERIWKNWYIDKRQAKTKTDLIVALRKRLIDEKFNDAVIFELIPPMTLKQFQEFESRLERLNNLCTEAKQ